MFCKIKQIIRKIKEWPYHIKHGIRNLIIWFPVIWKDRWWDYYFIYTILRRKLHLMEKNIRLHGHHTKHIEDADKIKKCVLLLDRLIEDDYHENVFKHHDEKWGDGELLFKDSTNYPHCYEADIKYPNVKTKEDDELQSKEYKLLSKKPQELIKQDLDLLFKLMRKNIQTWWD